MPRLGENPKRGIVLLFDYYRCMAQCTLFRRALKSSASMALGVEVAVVPPRSRCSYGGDACGHHLIKGLALDGLRLLLCIDVTAC